MLTVSASLCVYFPTLTQDLTELVKGASRETLNCAHMQNKTLNS